MVDKCININASELLLRLYESFSFFKKRRKGFQFLNNMELIQFFITLNYSKEVVIVISDCKKAFTTIPKLIIMKRDDLSTYLMGIANDMAIIEFSDVKIAEDWVFSMPVEADLHYIIFDKGVPYRDEKGLIDGKGKDI